MDELPDWDDVSGRHDPKQRFRVYRLHHTEEEPKLLATCTDETHVGITICELARGGEFDDAALGILDTEGEKGHRWLVKPWLPQVPDA